jgi:hypothetical protein
VTFVVTQFNFKKYRDIDINNIGKEASEQFSNQVGDFQVLAPFYPKKPIFVDFNFK